MDRRLFAAEKFGMSKTSAGILLFRKRPAGIEVLLAHPGGPFWAKKEEGAWSIPKGLVDEGEDALVAAKREFFEETGAAVEGKLAPLGFYRQPGGKMVLAFACEGDFDPSALKSNTFALEWPPRSGKIAEFPEIDRVGWFGLDEAAIKILKGQRPILAALIEQRRGNSPHD